jgi:hypothetical protein
LARELGVISEKAALLSAIESVIDTNAVALQLLSFYPESRMAPEQIARQVERTAVMKGAPLMSYKRPAL